MLSPDSPILIVDDMKTMRMVLAKHLSELGYSKISQAEDGEVAWAMLAKGGFHLVISDWNMPKMRGIDLLKKVRADGKLKDTPFIMVTAEVEGESEEAARADEYRVSAFLHKPFKKEELAAKIALATDKKKAA